MPSSLLEVKHGHGHSKHRKNKGNKNNDEIISTEKTKRRDMDRVPNENEYDGQKDMGR